MIQYYKGGKMTKKDYKLLAEVIAMSKNLDEFVDLLCDALKHENPRFKKDLFINYIEVLRKNFDIE